MAREVQHMYSSCMELDGKLQSKEGNYIALTAIVVKAYETKEVGDNFFRNVFVADTTDAKGKLRVSLKSQQRKYLDNLKEGNRYVFKGFLNVDEESGALSIGGAYATRVKEESSPVGGNTWPGHNPRSYIVGMMFNQGMTSFAPMTFSNSDYQGSIRELGMRMACVIRTITDERVDALLARANPTQPKETTEEPEDTDDPFGENDATH